MILREKPTKIIITIGTFFAFLIFGFADNLKGPLIPVLLEEFTLSYAQGSNILLMLYLGFMLSILGSGFLAGKYGNRHVLLLSGIVISLAVAGMSLVQDKILLYPLFFSIGIALGGIEVGANGAITDIYHEKSGKYLNLLAVFHGAGSMIAPWMAGILLEKNLPWQTAYKGSFLPILLFPLIFLFLRFTSPKSQKNNINNLKSANKLINTNLILLALLIMLYVAGEIGISSWIVDYLYKVKNFSLKSASIMLTLFWAFMMLGRLIASLIVDRIGYIKSLIITVCLALISFGVGVLPGKYSSYLLPLTGLFFAMIFPTAIAVAAKIFPKNKARALSFLFFFAGLGGLIGPWIVGYAANWFGIAIGFPMLMIFIIGSLVILLILKARLRS
ncbi:MAG: MFS transporter [Spirochaetia bacterium]|jgi:fucose permease|nr:MFS transporter [Spirochaetia bacterium]